MKLVSLLRRPHYFTSSVQQCPIQVELLNQLKIGNSNRLNDVEQIQYPYQFKYMSNLLLMGYLPRQDEINEVQRNLYVGQEVDQMNFLNDLLEELPMTINDPIYYTYLVDANAIHKNVGKCSSLISYVEIINIVQCYLRNITLDVQCLIQSIRVSQNQSITYSLLLYHFYKEQFQMSYPIADLMLRVIDKVKDERLQDSIKRDISTLTGNEYIRKRLQRQNIYDNQKQQQKNLVHGSKSKDKIIILPMKQGSMSKVNVNQQEMDLIRYMRKNVMPYKSGDEEGSGTDSMYGSMTSEDDQSEQQDSQSDGEYQKQTKFQFSRRSRRNREDSEDI